jgi:hypothetical protein
MLRPATGGKRLHFSIALTMAIRRRCSLPVSERHGVRRRQVATELE